MFRGEYEPKGGGAACVAGGAGAGRCLYENASGQEDLQLAERDDRTILRGGQGEPWPALCAHAWDTEHAGAVFPDSGGAKYQEAGGLFLSRFSSLSNTLPLRLYLNVGLCQWSDALPHRGKARRPSIENAGRAPAVLFLYLISYALHFRYVYPACQSLPSISRLPQKGTFGA